MTQLDLFLPEPSIRGNTTIGGRDVWYCPRRIVWTIDPQEVAMSDEQVENYRKQQVRDFDAVFGPPEAWK